MKNVARDEFGILSSKNTVSKYWGVSKVKGKEQFTVRFHDKVNKEVITFKPKGHELPEVVAAQIAARFFDEDDLYASSSIIGMIFKEGTAEVNTCTNIITFIPDDLVNNVQKTEKTTEFFEKLVVESVNDAIVLFPSTVGLVRNLHIEPTPKKENPDKTFRKLVDSIIASALSRAKVKLAAESAALYA